MHKEEPRRAPGKLQESQGHTLVFMVITTEYPNQNYSATCSKMYILLAPILSSVLK
jgi:hypothetical protein